MLAGPSGPARMTEGPVTKSRRFFKLASMTAQVAGSYAKTRIKSIFQSDEDVYLLEATFQGTVPTGGLASCISDEDESDIKDAWQEFIDSAKAGGSKVEMKPAPPEYGQ